jgi:hypothetical protein
MYRNAEGGWTQTAGAFRTTFGFDSRKSAERYAENWRGVAPNKKLLTQS